MISIREKKGKTFLQEKAKSKTMLNLHGENE